MLLALLVSAFASVPALATGLPTLSVDLDLDGRADTVRVLEGAPDSAFQVLEVALSASGRTLRFEKLVGKMYDELSDRQREETTVCASLLDRQLKAGPRGAFHLSEKGGDYGGCAGEWHRTLVVRLVRGELVVTQLLVSSNSWSMGDPSPILSLSFDFARGVLSGRSSDHHGNGKVAEGSVALNCGAQPLAGYESAAFSACAQAAAAELRKKMTIDCGRAYDTFSCPVKWEE